MTSNRPPAFFVGEHLALDFLNTTATTRWARVEWLADGKDLVDWLEQARSIEAAAAAMIREAGSGALDEGARPGMEIPGMVRRVLDARLRQALFCTPTP